ncbi:hypothetical protein [Pedobacter psychrodurus]|uniref:hypothetical protein n=1 Tax=Pedobacter psychrodurus TaxID=2530456 RepID=UPI00293101CF|nr:hypothetical protein [Pedobacter psychrodurus]
MKAQSHPYRCGFQTANSYRKTKDRDAEIELLLRAFEFTGDKKYLKEAETAAKKLGDVGYKIMYQANNTAFAAGALLRLFKLTNRRQSD